MSETNNAIAVLKRARAAGGLGLEVVATWARVPVDRITALESGAKPRPGELRRLRVAIAALLELRAGSIATQMRELAITRD